MRFWSSVTCISSALLLFAACTTETDPSTSEDGASGASGSGGSSPIGASGSGGADPIGSGGADPASSGGAEPVGSGGAEPVGSGGADPVGSGGAEPVGPTPACGDGPVGNQVGDLAEDFVLTDQHGATVRLSDYCGSVVYIALGAMWCPGCQGHAEAIPALVAEHGASGLVALNLMAETGSGDTPSQSDLAAWADNYEITTPVLADVDWAVWHRYWPETETPKEMLIGRDGRILELGWVGDRDLENAL